MADFSSICASVVVYLELILFMNGVANEINSVPIEPLPIEPPLPPQPPLPSQPPLPPLPSLPPWRDGEVVVSCICMHFALAPFIQSISRANRLPVWLTTAHLLLSSGTMYCTTFEFISALKKVDLSKKLLMKPSIPLVVAILVMLFRVFEKKHRAVRAALGEAAAVGSNPPNAAVGSNPPNAAVGSNPPNAGSNPPNAAVGSNPPSNDIESQNSRAPRTLASWIEMYFWSFLGYRRDVQNPPTETEVNRQNPRRGIWSICSRAIPVNMEHMQQSNTTA